MELQQLKRQLKRELKHQQATTQRSRRWPRLVSGLLVLALVAGAYWFYFRQPLELSQQLYQTCVKEESLGKIAVASTCYEEVYQTYPQAGDAASALFKLGKIRQYDYQDEKLALLNYLQLEHDYPTSKLVLPAREEAAKIVKYVQRDYSRAIEFYQQLLDLNAGTPDRYYYEISDCYFRLEKFSQARIELETLIEEYPTSALVADALYRKGAIWVLEGQPEAARHDWQQLIEQYPDSRHRVAAEFDLAKLLEEGESLKEALLLYRQLNKSNSSLLLQQKIEHLKQRIADKKEAL